uniref:Uncharacterized protein n=1 Tax=Yoonia rhodophyticola TaxID=3137370 RepID=A0AAN0NIG6_9RHOB
MGRSKSFCHWVAASFFGAGFQGAAMRVLIVLLGLMEFAPVIVFTLMFAGG